MKRILVGLVIAMGIFPTASLAQTNLDYSRIYVSDSPTYYFSWGYAPSGSFANTFYLVMEIALTDPGEQSTAGIKAWDAALDVPPEVQVFQRTLNPASSLNAGDEQANEWAVGTGTKVFLRDMPMQVVTYTYGNFNDFTDAVISLGPASTSSTDPAEPSWVFWPDCPEADCDMVYPFSDWEGNDMSINCTNGRHELCIVDPVEKHSWGGIKSRY